MKSYSLFVAFIYLWISPSTAQKADPVDITLYYESLCPGCRYFINHQYYRAFKSIGNIMNVGLVPYGNAEEKKKAGKWVFSCQHGKEECIGNLIETCATHFYPNTSTFFPFIHCIESSSKIPRVVAPSCAQKFNLNYSKIESCANGDLGNSLEHEMALKTEALKPDHTYVPWITLNGVHTEEIENKAESDLVKLVCNTYKGSPKPQACEEYQNGGFIQRCWKNSGSKDNVEKNSNDIPF